MGFAGFINSGLTPAIGGALRGRNMATQRAEEQRRYEAEQAQQASEVKWRQQQALEAAQRQAMMDALAQQAQMASQKGVAESRRTQQDTLAQQAAQADLNRKNALEIARLGATSRENVAGINVKGKIAAKATPAAGAEAGKTLPSGAVDQLFELQSILRTAKGGAEDFRTHPEAFGPQNRIPFYDLIPGTGSQHRINMGNLVSLIGKARSGGAITPQEFQRLERFLPNPGSLDEKNDGAIPILLREIEAIIADRQNYYRQQGYAVPGDTPAGITRPAAPAANEGDPVDAAYQRWLQRQGQ